MEGVGRTIMGEQENAENKAYLYYTHE